MKNKTVLIVLGVLFTLSMFLNVVLIVATSQAIETAMEEYDLINDLVDRNNACSDLVFELTEGEMELGHLPRLDANLTT